MTVGEPGISNERYKIDKIEYKYCTGQPKQEAKVWSDSTKETEHIICNDNTNNHNLQGILLCERRIKSTNMKVTKQDMRWTNEPEKWKQKDEEIKVWCPEEVDYWRNTLHGFVKDDAPFYWMYVDYDFEARLSLKGKFKYLYDQAGMMIRLDEENWIKCGIAHYRDQLYVSTVFTRGNSDWSTHRLPKMKIDWFHIWCKRRGEVVECFYSLDNENWIRIRQGYFSDAPRLRVGMMCAAPESAGIKVTFSNFLIKGGVDDEDFVDENALDNPALSLLPPDDEEEED